MSYVKLYSILFEAEEVVNMDISKDVAAAVKTSLEPLTKDVEQVKKDIQVIQKSSGGKKEDPTNARSTTGAIQTSSATTIPKDTGTKSTTEPSNTGGSLVDVAALGKDVANIKTQVTALTDLAKKG